MKIKKALMVVETKPAMQDMGIHRGGHEWIYPNSKEVKKGVKNM